MSDATQPSPEFAALINAPANASPLEADVEKAIADTERPADPEAQLEADVQQAIPDDPPEPTGEPPASDPKSMSWVPKPPTTRAECQAKMDAQHVHIAEVEAYLAKIRTDLDGLIRLHNLLK